MAGVQEWYLRRASGEDVEGLYALLCIPLVYRYLADGVAPPRSVIEQWIRRSHADGVARGMGLWVLENRDVYLAGGVCLSTYSQPRSAELTYLLHPQVWGQGLATRMSWTVMQQAFEAGHIDAIVAGADVPNAASVAVMQRLGMHFLRPVQYPVWPGVEYIYRRDDPVPIPVPVALPLHQ